MQYQIHWLDGDNATDIVDFETVDALIEYMEAKQRVSCGGIRFYSGAMVRKQLGEYFFTWSPRSGILPNVCGFCCVKWNPVTEMHVHDFITGHCTHSTLIAVE